VKRSTVTIHANPEHRDSLRSSPANHHLIRLMLTQITPASTTSMRSVARHQPGDASCAGAAALRRRDAAARTGRVHHPRNNNTSVHASASAAGRPAEPFDDGSGTAAAAGNAAPAAGTTLPTQQQQQQQPPPTTPQKASSRIKEMQQQLSRYGLAGMLAYGLLNTLYYSCTFLFVWVCVVKVPTGLGLAGAARKFLEVFALTWGGSQVSSWWRAFQGCSSIAAAALRVSVWCVCQQHHRQRSTNATAEQVGLLRTFDHVDRAR